MTTNEERAVGEEIIARQLGANRRRRLFYILVGLPACILAACALTGFTPWWLLLPSWGAVGLYIAAQATSLTENSPRLFAFLFAGVAIGSSLGVSRAPREALHWMFTLTSKSFAPFVHSPVAWIWVACYFAGMCAGYRLREQQREDQEFAARLMRKWNEGENQP